MRWFRIKKTEDICQAVQGLGCLALVLACVFLLPFRADIPRNVQSVSDDLYPLRLLLEIDC